MKRGFYLVLTAIAFIALIACNGSKDISELKDGPKLRQDCLVLLSRIPQGEIPQTAWPRSIKELEPMRVSCEQDKVRILLRRENGRYTVGYDIFADTTKAPSTQGVWVQKTKVKGIWVFKQW